jgi:hypothetical protein
MAIDLVGEFPMYSKLLDFCLGLQPFSSDVVSTFSPDRTTYFEFDLNSVA